MPIYPPSPNSTNNSFLQDHRSDLDSSPLSRARSSGQQGANVASKDHQTPTGTVKLQSKAEPRKLPKIPEGAIAHAGPPNKFQHSPQLVAKPDASDHHLGTSAKPSSFDPKNARRDSQRRSDTNVNTRKLNEPSETVPNEILKYEKNSTTAEAWATNKPVSLGGPASGSRFIENIEGSIHGYFPPDDDVEAPKSPTKPRVLTRDKWIQKAKEARDSHVPLFGGWSLIKRPHPQRSQTMPDLSPLYVAPPLIPTTASPVLTPPSPLSRHGRDNARVPSVWNVSPASSRTNDQDLMDNRHRRHASHDPQVSTKNWDRDRDLTEDRRHRAGHTSRPALEDRLRDANDGSHYQPGTESRHRHDPQSVFKDRRLDADDNNTRHRRNKIMSTEYPTGKPEVPFPNPNQVPPWVPIPPTRPTSPPPRSHRHHRRDSESPADTRPSYNSRHRASSSPAEMPAQRHQKTWQLSQVQRTGVWDRPEGKITLTWASRQGSRA